ncbi:MAG: hypothetical protein ACYDHH_23355 [Solirubrobacteraceae bacterium]
MARRRALRAAWAPGLTVMLTLALMCAASAPALAASNPSVNRDPSAATNAACGQAPVSLDCDIAALTDINAARAAEGIGPMVLPTNYESLTQPQQLLVIANLERIGRGLVPASGLSPSLNVVATVGALANKDPYPTSISGNVFASNWAGGVASPLFIDFLWMYDDGVGSYNLDCNAASDPGCWGHRDNILYPFDAPVGFGAAELTTQSWGSSVTELFVGGDLALVRGAADALLGPTWTTLSQSLRPLLSAASMVFGAGTSTSRLQVTASAQTITVSAGTSSGWQVSPTSCQLSPGASCTLNVSRTPGASPTSGKLTLTGPAGNSTVTLSSAVTPLRIAAQANAKPKPKPKAKLHHKRPSRKSHR